MLSLENRLKKINRNINGIAGLRPVKLENFFCNDFKGVYFPKPKKGQKSLEDYFKGDCCEIIAN